MKERKSIRVAAAVIRDGDTIFATQRGYGEYKDWWEFPGGKIEPGETPQEALVREIREELDTDILVDELLMTVEYDYPKFHLSMDCFWCRVKSGNLTLLEHEAARWLPLNDLWQVQWLPADFEVLKKIERENQRNLPEGLNDPQPGIHLEDGAGAESRNPSEDEEDPQVLDHSEDEADAKSRDPLEDEGDPQVQTNPEKEGFPQNQDQPDRQKKAQRVLPRTLEIFLTFLKFGCFTFGGGWGIVAQIQKEYVEKRHWITDEELLDFTSVGRSLPGLMIGNASVMFGYQVDGVAGAIAALLGITIPPVAIMIGVTILYSMVRDNMYAARAMMGVRAAVVPIILSALIRLFHSAMKDVFCYAIAIIALCLCLFTGLNNVLIVLIGAAAGLIYMEARTRHALR